jgi:thiol-disulfide isomerase/thioredoxin
MLSALLLALTPQAVPTIEDVYRKVREMPGVEIQIETLSPSVVQILFRVSPQGAMTAKYPTSEEFIGLKKTVTWMADRREYAERVNEGGNPVPAGFEPLWPGGKLMPQIAPAVAAVFQGKPSYRIDCKADAGYTVHLFVDSLTLIPRGTQVDWQGARYESVYKTVTVRPFDAASLQFRPPKDARVAGKWNPLASLIKPGTKLASFTATDYRGKKHSLKSLLAGRKGLVLNFWFSACTGCVAEMPFLRGLHSDLVRRKIGLVGVNPIDEASIALRTAQGRSLPYTSLVGPGAVGLAKQVGVQAYPVTVILNGLGVVLEVIPVPDEERIRAGVGRIGL